VTDREVHRGGTGRIRRFGAVGHGVLLLVMQRS